MGKRNDLILAVETCVLQTLEGNRGKSNVKTSILHGSMEKYIESRSQKNIKWKHEETLKQNGFSFKVDMLATSSKKDIVILLKNPVRSLNKNKKNNLVNSWGEAIRVSLIREQSKKKLGVLSIMIYPTKDVIIEKKNTEGRGRTKFSNFTPDSSSTYNSGYDMLKPNLVEFRHIGIPFEYVVTPTLKSLSGVHRALKKFPEGKRITIQRETWKELDNAVDWLVEGFN